MPKKGKNNIEIELPDIEVDDTMTDFSPNISDNENIAIVSNKDNQQNEKRSLKKHKEELDERYAEAKVQNDQLRARIRVGSGEMKFSRESLEKLLEIAEENPDAQLPEIFEIYRSNALENNPNLRNMLKTYKKYYHMRPEEILVADQRYYYEKQLAQQNEIEKDQFEEMCRHNSEMEREARELREARIEANRQERIARQKAEYESEMERLNQRSEQRKAEQEESFAKSRAMDNCRRCAKFLRCRNTGIVGCGAFVPK